MSNGLQQTASHYVQHGLCVLPANRQVKYPCIDTWKQYQTRLPTQIELEAWFSNPQDGLCIITGAISGHLEMIDFDLAGELFSPWCEKVKAQEPTLLDRLVFETTQSGGWHAIYRCETDICGSMKLAQRRVPVEAKDIYLKENREYVRIAGKEFAVRQDDSGKHAIATLIETRGRGGLFVCAPTAGYELMQGDFTSLPVLTESERQIMLEAAWSLNEYIPKPAPTPTGSDPTGLRPGDDYNARGNTAELLKSHGWQLAHTAGDKQRWRRPGKDIGWSATLWPKDNVFYVFSSNAAPFEADTAYSAFMAYTLLEHNGDFRKAAAELARLGYGEKQKAAEPADISGIIADIPEEIPYCPPAELIDPGAFPDAYLRIPGFVAELMDFCMESAPYPNLGLAFCGALAMQSYLCGRKVRDCGNLRTNLYLLALAGSSSGKDWARQLNAHIMMEIGKLDALGDKFASGEAIQDAMFLTPSMIFQNDEIDGILVSLNKSRDARFESIMGTMLTMHTSAGSIYPMRRKAGKESGGIIDQPHLTIFGTATPKYYYESLSERMLTNGFFARMIVVDIGYRGKGKDAGLIDQMPLRILETAKWWDNFCPGQQRGNLLGFHPTPIVITATEAAKEVLHTFRFEADEEYAKAEGDNNESAKAIWGRANENARKLALLYACSQNHLSPEISEDAASWAIQFVNHQIRRMLYLAGQHAFENEFDRKCKRMSQLLNGWKNQKGNSAWMPHWELARRLKGWTEKDFEIVRESLSARFEIECEVGSTRKGGPVGYRYRLR